MKKVLKILAYVGLIISVICLAFTTYFYIITANVKLDLEKLKSVGNRIELYYDNGEKIETPSALKYVEFDEIPSHLINSLIAVEDKRFYLHNGVDFKGVLRALKSNLFSGKIKEGGSTITQQLVKNTYLSGEKTLSRKLREIKLATLLENKLTKNQILEKYLNTVYFGENAYGIASASKKYFNKEVKDLTVSEGATLVACLKAPSYYNPIKNPQKARERRDLVLEESFKQGLLTQKSLNVAKSAEITVDFSSNYDLKNTLYNEVLSSALEILGEDNLTELSGYKIKTSIDKTLSERIIKIGNLGLNTDVEIIVTDNLTREIIGYNATVGNLKRCPASTAKPWLIYAPAIEENLVNLATKILDEKTSFDGYSPSNYNEKYYGYVSVKKALSKSLNVPSVKLCSALGLNKVKSYAEKMGINYENNDLSVALGNLSGGVTLKELSDAYSVFSNGGKRSKSSLISEIINHKGKTVYKFNKSEKRIFSEDTAFLINDALRDCALNGTANKLSSLPFCVYAKTGTNGSENGNTDAYCVAYTKNHTVTVWMGNASGKAMDNSVTGGNYPTAIAKSLLEMVYKDFYPSEISPPKTVKRVLINKELYEKDCKIFEEVGAEKDGLYFWFKSDFMIEKLPKERISPIVKSCKITCNKRDIEIFYEKDEKVYVKIEDENSEVFYEGNIGNSFLYRADSDGEYQFYITPYVIENDEKIYGEKIKLPSVKAEGKKDILNGDWWED